MLSQRRRRPPACSPGAPRTALAALFVAAVAAAAALPRGAGASAGGAPADAAKKLLWPVGSRQNPAKYSLEFTAASGNPDCFGSTGRTIILTNGQFQPTFTFYQGDFVEITVKNSLPPTLPTITNGVSVHWHGLSLKGYPWADGTRMVSQCAIQPGASATFRFQVNEMPGTYLWHDHASLNRADGAEGPLIVRPARGTKELFQDQYSQEATLFLSDWWHYTGNALTMRLNRPVDPSIASNSSGQWCWVGLPKSILINGRGRYADCEDVYLRAPGQPLPNTGANATKADLLAPTTCLAGQLGPAAAPATCSVAAAAPGAKSAGSGGSPGLVSQVKSALSSLTQHTKPSPSPPGPAPGACRDERVEVVVARGATARLRIINGGQLVYMTVCVQSHWLTVVALDAAPVAPRRFWQCADVNTGQRLDVLLTADQAPGAYWISVGAQYRKGAPAGYAVLRYKDSTAQPDPKAIIQPAAFVDLKWNDATLLGFKPAPQLLDPKNNAAAAKPYLSPASPNPTFQLPQRPIDRRFVLQSSQPIVGSQGFLRWAMDAVAHVVTPPCRPVLDAVYDDPAWAAKNALPADSTPGADEALYFTPLGGAADTWQRDGKGVQVVDKAGANADVLINLHKPGAANHAVTLRRGEYVEIVVQNNRAGAFGGEYNSSNNGVTNARNGREQHSFHLHGHHFWQVGSGPFGWSPDKVNGPEYNLLDPPLRDTTTVFFAGTTEEKAAWTAFRFVADSPGIWPFHCHIAFHEYMGQGLNFIEAPEDVAKLEDPADKPVCSTKCYMQNANFGPPAVKAVYGANNPDFGPDNSNP